MNANQHPSHPDHDRFGFGLFSHGLYIGGAWRPAAGEGRIQVIDPSTEAVIVAVPDATVADAAAAVEAAASATERWRETPPRKRSEILRRCFELMVERSEMLATLVSLENGKALRDARGEVAYAAEFFRWNAEEAVRISGEFGIAPVRCEPNRRRLPAYRHLRPHHAVELPGRNGDPQDRASPCCRLHRHPEARERDAADGLCACGPSTRRLACPPGVVNVLTTSTPGPVIAAMLADPRVRKLSFTGSTGVGRTLLAEAAKNVISCSMELGGNAPFIVFDDADLDAAIEGLMVAKMRNAGEACTAANRIYVQAGIHDAFAEKFTQRMAALRVGPGVDSDTECGPMITRKAVEKIDRLVADAISRGARVALRRTGTGRTRLFLSADRACECFPGLRHGPRGDFRARGAALPFRERGRGRRSRQRYGTWPLPLTSIPATSAVACASPRRWRQA